MATNPLIAQGSLNRVKASVSWNDFPGLNITAPYLGRDGVSLALEGQSTAFLGTMTGAVTSPEVYMMIGLTAHLLKSQALCAAYQLQLVTLSLLGNGVVRPDVSEGLEPWDVINCAIENVREMRFNGQDEGFVIMCRGYIVVNNEIWQ